jgi:hypothetical protein
MTIQEKAIEWLTLLKEKFIGTEYSMYLDAAIQALKQQPSEEAISKAEAIRRIELRRKITCESDNHYDVWIRGYEEGIDDAIAMINSVPAVTPRAESEK